MAETGKGGADKSTSMRVDTALVRELAELLSANDLNEIEVEDGERKIKVRRDDQEATVRARLEVYERQTAPLLDYYRTRGLLREIDGSAAPDEVSRRIFDTVGAGN